MVPSGLWAMCSTRAVWPVNSAILTMDGYFHRHSWFCEYPWLDRISRSCVFHCRAHTCRRGMAPRHLRRACLQAPCAAHRHAVARV